MERIICLAAGYLCGLFQTGYIYGKLHGIDIRSYGSGNSGSTNALRVMGKKAGLTVFVGDFLKTVIPCFITRLLFKVAMKGLGKISSALKLLNNFVNAFFSVAEYN